MKRKRILQKLANCISYDIKEGIVRFIPLYALTGVFCTGIRMGCQNASGRKCSGSIRS